MLIPVALLALAVTASPASAERVVPPNNPVVNQYTETYPGPGGETETNDRHREAKPKAVLGGHNAHELEALGPEGKAAAVLAAATFDTGAATVVPPGSGGGGGGNAGGRQGSGGHGGVVPAAGQGGGSGLGAVALQATGLSASSQTGPLAPLLIVAAIVGSLVYLWRRKRPA